MADVSADEVLPCLWHHSLLNKQAVMDRITNQLINDFLTLQDITAQGLEKDFELFTNYCVVSKEYNRTFDTRAVTVGAGNDTGIDGIGIIVNGYLVEDIEEVSDLLEQNGYIEATYVFIQAKTSPSFDSQGISSFCFGVKDFFSESPGLIRNEDIVKFAEISDFVLSKAADFKEEPKCRMYYVTTGRWSDDLNHLAVINSSKSDLSSYNIFNEIDFHPIGATEISKLYRQTKTPDAVEFTFAEKVTLPETKGINEAYYGILPFSEFKKILVDDNDNIRSIFDDNVRDFQGAKNPVNSKISDTLTGDNSEQFVVFNNGVTVVSTSLKTAGNKFVISDFQIVNGCQTSNVLYQNRNSNNVQDLHVPFRLIVTDTDSVKSQITLATNSQTAIKTEQLAVLSDFQRNLELYYAATDGDGALFYERRARQYSNDSSVVKSRVITVANQIKSFSAMFLQNPHLVTSFFGSIAKKLGSGDSKIFKEKHSYAPYYLSGLAFYKLDSLFRSGAIDSRYKKAKFHLLMIFRLLAEDEKVPPLDSTRKMEKYCNPIVQKLLDPQECNNLFMKTTEVLDASEMELSDKQHVKQKVMVDNLLTTYQTMATDRS